MRYLFAVSLALLLAAPAAHAQSGFTPYVGYDTEFEELLVGVGFRFGTPIPSPVTIAFQPSLDVIFVDNATVLQGDANLIGEFNAGGAVAPFAGAGIGVFNFDPEGAADGNTELGFNILGGLTFNSVGFVRPYVQGEYSTRGDFTDAARVKAGVIFGF